MDDYNYKDSYVYVKDIGKFRQSVYRRKWKCPVCNSYIEDEETVCMVLNNFKYFPNTLVHDECFIENDSEQVFMEIENKYKTYSEIEDMF